MVQKGRKLVPATVQDMDEAMDMHWSRVQDKLEKLENWNKKHKALIGIGKKENGKSRKPSHSQKGQNKICAMGSKAVAGLITEIKTLREMYNAALSVHKSEIQNLRSRDNRNDGPNTPPSKNSVTGQQKKAIRNNSKHPSGRKPGGQPGHKGANKGEHIKIDKTEKHTLDACTCCGSKNIQDVEEITAIRTEIPPKPKAVTTKYIIVTYSCDDCVEGQCDCSGKDSKKEEVVHEEIIDERYVETETVEDPDAVPAIEIVDSPDAKGEPAGYIRSSVGAMTARVGIPRDGMYGVNALIEVLDNHIKRQPNRMNSDSMSRDDVGMSNGTISHVLDRFGKYTAAPTEEIKRRIRRCIILNADETSIRYKGTTYWLWVFYDPLTGTAYYIIRNSRGPKVPREVLGPDWKDILVCDGWSAYNNYRMQRCWAHIIRELETLSLKNPDSKEAAAALATLRKIFHDAKETCKKPKHIRVKSIKNLRVRVRRLIRKYSDDPVIGEFMPKLGRALPNLFHFVIDPRIPPTNNFAEQHLRESVIVRRIRGSIRSEKSLDRTAALLTCITTWKNHGLDPLEEMKKYIPMI